MRKTYRKNIRRTITQTVSRFGAIFAIVALGVGFLVGLLSATPDMRYSGDVFFDDTALFDVRVVGGLGLTEEDMQAVRALDEVQDIMPAYTADMLVTTPAGDNLTTRIHSVPLAQLQAQNPTGYLNRFKVLEGRLPENAGECVIETNGVYSEYAFGVGDTLTLAPENKKLEDTFNRTQYKIVGVVTSSYYFSIETEASSVGNGTVGLVMYVGEQNFALDVYTDAYLTVKGAKELNSLQTKYEDTVDAVVQQLEDISGARCQARFVQVKTDGISQLADAKQEYADGKAEAEQKLADAWKEIQDGEKEIADGEKELAEALQSITDGQAELDDTKDKLPGIMARAEEKLAAAQNELITARDALAAAQLGEPQLQQAVLGYTQAQAQAQAAVAAAQQAVDNNGGENAPQNIKDALAQAQAAYTAVSATLADYQAKLAEAQAAIATLPGLISEGEAKLAEGWAAKDAAYADALRQIEAAEKQLADARVQYNDGVNELAEAKQTLADGKKEYTEKKADADKELADAAAEIAVAQETLDTLEVPQWYVLTRSSNPSVASFKSNVEKVEAIAKIFPVFFFFVAALVALTTMTRMVEEERLQIGTLKALGYGKATIMAKYLFYALTASVLGSAAGLAVGFWLFPTVIWNAYTMMYLLPKLYCLFNWQYALTASGAAVACTLLATLNACWATLREKPATLMLPKAPKAGKRILLERIPFIWKPMKFTHKVTARNLFRYKKRLAMTVIGIAGCTALLVTGFGLHDSISDIVSKQFGQIFTYDAMVGFKNVEVLRGSALQKVLNDDALVKEYLAVHQEKCTNTIDGETFNTYIFVPDEADKMTSFVSFRQRLSGEEVAWEKNSVIITEKMSERTGLFVGDEMTLANKDDAKGTFTVTGVTENYVENYVYMSRETYEDGFGEQAEISSLVLQGADNTPAGRDALGTALLGVDDITGVRFIATLKDSFSNMMSKIDIIVVVLIVSAGALAFIVLYNLTNINITERVKEIATIKVLGFTDKEVNAYVYRESMLLAFIGTLLGLGLGILLHKFVIMNVEVDVVMFGRSIKALSYVYAAALTMAFSMLVNLVMHRKLRNISMVESMKAPE